MNRFLTAFSKAFDEHFMIDDIVDGEDRALYGLLRLVATVMVCVGVLGSVGQAVAHMSAFTQLIAVTGSAVGVVLLANLPLVGLVQKYYRNTDARVGESPAQQRFREYQKQCRAQDRAAKAKDQSGSEKPRDSSRRGFVINPFHELWRRNNQHGR